MLAGPVSGIRDCVRSPAYHIVEEPGSIERMIELERPTEEDYKLLREDMGVRHPKVADHVLDHLLSLQAFCDNSILSGFSFGMEKAQVLVSEGKLLARPMAQLP